MTHTPGPWHFTANMYGIDNMRVFGVEEINDDFTQGIANCGFGEGCEANARLIAAAPEMLEALKLLAEEVDDLSANNLDAHNWTHHQNLLTLAHTAINKATGV
jgi:hypothetical protein